MFKHNKKQFLLVVFGLLCYLFVSNMSAQEGDVILAAKQLIKQGRLDEAIVLLTDFIIKCEKDNQKRIPVASAYYLRAKLYYEVLDSIKAESDLAHAFLLYSDLVLEENDSEFKSLGDRIRAGVNASRPRIFFEFGVSYSLLNSYVRGELDELVFPHTSSFPPESDKRGDIRPAFFLLEAAGYMPIFSNKVYLGIGVSFNLSRKDSIWRITERNIENSTTLAFHDEIYLTPKIMSLDIAFRIILDKSRKIAVTLIPSYLVGSVQGRESYKDWVLSYDPYYYRTAWEYERDIKSKTHHGYGLAVKTSYAIVGHLEISARAGYRSLLAHHDEIVKECPSNPSSFSIDLGGAYFCFGVNAKF